MKIKNLVALLIVQVIISSQLHSQVADYSLEYVKKQGYGLEACYRLAEEFLTSSSEQYKAIGFLEFIVQNDAQAEPIVLFQLAQAYYYKGNYDLAIQKINEYIIKENNAKKKKLGKDELAKFENAKRIAAIPIDVRLINMGAKINTKFAEINPFVSQYENLLVFSSKRGTNFDIYVSKKGIYDNYWARSKLAGDYINTINDEFVAGLSKSGKDLFVHYNQVSGFEDINMSLRRKGLYRELEDPGIKVNSTYKEEGACISKNSDTLYFASDRPGGYGGFDIYYSLKLPDGTWGIATNMGPTVNTEFDENYPNLSNDGNTLYFASKGHNSIGGFDVFHTSFNPSTKTWNKPQNMGYPINNAYDNKNIAFTENERYAYISTINEQSQGDFDIYKVIFNKVSPEYVIVKAKVFIVENGDSIPFNEKDESLIITVSKDDETYGMYSFDKRNNSFVLALLPGAYILEIDSDNYKPFKKRIRINENYYRNKYRAVIINLEPSQ